jgi:hypothetical protein
MGDLTARIVEVVEADKPMTVRQVFYRLVAAGVIEKTELQYRAVIRMLTDMREADTPDIPGDDSLSLGISLFLGSMGEADTPQIPWDWIVDSTRRVRKPLTFSDPRAAVVDLVESYRRSYWGNQPRYVEIILEKDALAGVFEDVTDALDVALLVVRGFSSRVYLHDTADRIREQDKPAFVFLFGDHDPSGVDISRDAAETIERYAPDADVTFQRVAVTPEQIQEWNLPTRPTKSEDPRAKNWDGESVELDAIPPAALRELVRDCIAGQIDVERWKASEKAEKADRKKLKNLLPKLG